MQKLRQALETVQADCHGYRGESELGQASAMQGRRGTGQARLRPSCGAKAARSRPCRTVADLAER